MTKLLLLALSLLFTWIPDILCEVTTAGELTVLEGQSIKVPCHYEPQYAGYVKYWCQGRMREFCTSLARTDETHVANPAEDKVTITDDPIQLVFTVTMNNLKKGDSGWYMCGVEIGSGWTADVATYLNVNVIHGLSVVNNQLTGEEGSSVAVECLYSERYREIEKKWCRLGDWSSCVLTGSEGRYEDASLAISDDRTRTLTVTLKKLQSKDTGWYWCSAGQQQLAVHVQVTPRSTTMSISSAAVSTTSPVTPSQTAAHPPPKSITKQSWNSCIFESLLVCSSLMLLVVTVILAIKLWRLHNRQYLFLGQDSELRGDKEEKERIDAGGDLQKAGVILPNREVAYMYRA